MKFKIFSRLILKLFFVMLVLPSTGHAFQVFSEDPVREAGSPFVTNEFMQLTLESPYDYLHTAIDVRAPAGTNIYAPLSSGKTATIAHIDSNFVMIYGNEYQNGNYALALLLHLTPNPNLSEGEVIDRNDVLGTLTSTETKKDISNHLHFELYLSPTGSFNANYLYNPRRHAFENAHWNSCSTTLMLSEDIVVWVSTAPQITWDIHACDLNNGINNGIGGLALKVNDRVEYEVDFDKFNTNANKADIYFCDTGKQYIRSVKTEKPEGGNAEYRYVLESLGANGGEENPGSLSAKSGEKNYEVIDGCYIPGQSGTNNPNILRYRAEYTLEEGQNFEYCTWQLKWWDSPKRNDEETAVNNPPGVDLSFDFRGQFLRDGRYRLKWDVNSIRDITGFNVYQFRNPDDVRSGVNWLDNPDAVPINSSPIFTEEGRLAYSYDAELPRNWDRVYCRVSMIDHDGHEIPIPGGMNLNIPKTVISSMDVYPNPANPDINIKLSIEAYVDGLTIDIFNVRGERVRTFLTGPLQPGVHTLRWDGKDENGKEAASGTYVMSARGRSANGHIVKFSLVK